MADAVDPGWFAPADRVLEWHPERPGHVERLKMDYRTGQYRVVAPPRRGDKAPGVQAVAHSLPSTVRRSRMQIAYVAVAIRSLRETAREGFVTTEDVYAEYLNRVTEYWKRSKHQVVGLLRRHQRVLGIRFSGDGRWELR